MCVGGPQVEYTPKEDNPTQYDIKRIDSASFVQRYSADEQLLAEYPVDFKPTAINLIPGKDEFVVAGEGWLVRMTLAGEVIKKSRTPNIGDYEEFKVKALEGAKEDLKQYAQQFEIQKKQAEETIEELEKKPEADRNANDKAQIEAQKSMLKMFDEQIGQIEQMFGVTDPEQAVRDRLTITGIAAADSDLFISIRKLKGHGYQVWRTNFDFEQGEKVVDDLGGCCGQLDIQASGDKLLIAENGKFRVGIYDRDGDQHYDVTSAFIKSVRGSDPDAALHYLARMLEAGEDPRFIARRLMILASEDIGMADPNVLQTAVAAAQAVALVGMPEAQIILAHATIHASLAAKSNAVVTAIGEALADVRSGRIGRVPEHLRDAHSPGARTLGHGAGYLYPHDLPGGVAAQQYLPDELLARTYYRPTRHGAEAAWADVLARLSASRAQTAD